MIYLVRHGEYEGNGTLIPGRLPVILSSNGIAQAEKLRDFFADKEIMHIFTSPVKRAVQTAEIIGREVLAPESDLRLAETFTAYQGQRYASSVDWSDGYRHRQELGGEGILDQQKRMREFWDDVIAHETENVVIVSHGHPLWTLYCSLIGKEMDTADIEDTGEVNDPDYQEMGMVRPLRFEHGNIVSEPMIKL